MDGACMACLDVAYKKAKNSILTARPSSDLGKRSNPFPSWSDGPLFRVEHTNDGLISFGGGFPIFDPVSGALLGSIGSSSGSVAQDEMVSGAGAAAAVRNVDPPFAIPPTAPSLNCTLSLELSYWGLDAAKKASDSLNISYNLAILDNFGRMKAFWRMDDAPLASIDVALKKATTSSMFGAPTDAFMNASSPGQGLYSIQVSNGNLVVFGGGLPIKRGGAVVGAIGTSAGSAAQDILVSNAAVQVAGAANCAPKPSDDSGVKVWAVVIIAIATFFAGVFGVLVISKIRGAKGLNTQDSQTRGLLG